MTGRRDLPAPSAPNFLTRVREEIHALTGKTGSPSDKALTLREAIDAGVLTPVPGGGFTPGAAEYRVDLTPPPPPSGLAAVTSGASIVVTVDPQTYRQGNGPGKVTVYAAKYFSGDPLPVFADAAVMDEFPGDVHAFAVDPAASYRIWAKSVSRDGVSSTPAGGTNGVEPTTGALDDAAIANLTASRIRSGSVTVGQFIQAASYVPGVAGWRINGDGTAEFSQVSVRGTIFASQGAVGGWAIGSNYLQSSSYVLGSSGTRLNSDGTGQIGGITIYPQGLGAGSTGYDTGAGAWIGRDGRLSLRNASGTQHLKWDGSALQISGDLQAATGTFSGVLTVDAVNAVGTVNIAGNAVTVPGAAAGQYEAMVSLLADVPMSFSMVGTFTQGVGKSSHAWQLRLDGTPVAEERPAADTTGAMTALVAVAPGVHQFSIECLTKTGDGRCGITVIGIKR